MKLLLILILHLPTRETKEFQSLSTPLRNRDASRIFKGKNAFYGDRNHIHHLLIDKFSI